MARLTLSAHWKFHRLAAALESRVLARGVLETLWEPCWAACDPYVGTSSDIEAQCEWKGKVGALTQALLTAGGSKGAGFIELYTGDVRDKSEPHYQIHDFYQHAPTYVRVRHNAEGGAYPRACAHCGEPFFAEHPRARFCKRACRQAAYRSSVTDPRDARDVTRDVTPNVTEQASRDAPVTVRYAPVTELSSRTVTGASQPSQITPSASNTFQPRYAPRDASYARLAKPSQAYVRTDVDSAAAESPPAPTTEMPGLELDDDDVRALDVRTLKQLDGTSGTKRRDVPAATTTTSPVALTFPVVGDGGPEWPLREDQIATWRALYPALDVLGEARQALAWVEADRTRRKTARGMRKFLVAWFNRSTDNGGHRTRGPTVLTGSLKTAGNEAALKEFLRGRGHVVE